MKSFPYTGLCERTSNNVYWKFGKYVIIWRNIVYPFQENYQLLFSILLPKCGSWHNVLLKLKHKINLFQIDINYHINKMYFVNAPSVRIWIWCGISLLQSPVQQQTGKRRVRAESQSVIMGASVRTRQRCSEKAERSDRWPQWFSADPSLYSQQTGVGWGDHCISPMLFNQFTATL